MLRNNIPKNRENNKSNNTAAAKATCCIKHLIVNINVD